MVILGRAEEMTEPRNLWSGGSLFWRFPPVPGQEVGKPGGRMIVDPAEHVGEPGLRIDAIKLGGLDQREHRRGTLAAAIGAGEQPGLAADRNAAQCPLGGVVRQADPAVVEKAGNGGVRNFV